MEMSVWSLWLPVVVSGVVLFFASWAAWMVLPHHKSDWRPLPNEGALTETIKEASVAPGQYMFPYCRSASDMKSEAHKAGPHGTLNVWDGPPNMALNMLCTLLFFVIANFVIAYLASMVIGPGTAPLRVFRFVATAGILTYGGANILNGIWFRRPMIKDIIDGIAYGLLTGLVFAWLWPTIQNATSEDPFGLTGVIFAWL